MRSALGDGDVVAIVSAGTDSQLSSEVADLEQLIFCANQATAAIDEAKS